MISFIVHGSPHAQFHAIYITAAFIDMLKKFTESDGLKHTCLILCYEIISVFFFFEQFLLMFLYVCILFMTNISFLGVNSTCLACPNIAVACLIPQTKHFKCMFCIQEFPMDGALPCSCRSPFFSFLKKSNF